LILREAEYRHVQPEPIPHHPLLRDYSTYRILRLNFIRPGTPAHWLVELDQVD